MAELSYTSTSGSVTLQLARSTRFEQRAVYDPSETDFLYTHTIIELEFIFNPAATASNQIRDANGVVVLPGDNPAVSLAALNHVMATPRGLLIVSIGGNTYCSSPRNFAVAGAHQVPLMDARNGPRILYPVQIVSIHGDKSIRARWGVETWIGTPNLAISQSQSGAMISHRWTVRHVTDTEDEMRTTKHVEGLVIFRSDVLQLEGVHPDDFRNKFGHPIPNGIMRKNVMVQQEADGLRIAYSFDDEEQTTNLNPNQGIVKIEAWLEYDMDWTGAAITAFGVSISPGLPTAALGLTLRLWGKRTMSRNQLANAAANVLNAITNGAWNKFPQRAFSIRMDMVGRFVEVTFRILKNGVFGGTEVLIGGPGLDDALQPRAGWPEQLGDIGNTTPGPNISPSASNAMRGSFLERLVAQTLINPGSNPNTLVVPGQIPLVPPASSNAQDVL